MKSEKLLREIIDNIKCTEFSVIKYEEQNHEYEGMLVQIDQQMYRSRLAKLTPKKQGYFVAFWEKSKCGNNQAYSYEDAPEKLIVSVIDNEKKGQFIFPKEVLLKYGVLKKPLQKGKMALRVYPGWITELNKNACKVQWWQNEYFIDLSQDFEIVKLQNLYA